MLRLAFIMVAVLIMAWPSAALATNGMNMIGTGAVASGMGGADVAVPAGCTAIAGNPAQLATTCNKVVSAGTALLMPKMDVKTPGSSEVGNENQTFPLPFLGYAQRIGVSPWSVGLGIFAQGGMGVDFREVPAGPGAKDDLYSQVAFLRFAPTVAYNVTDSFTLGASLFAGYATVNYEFFPNLPMGQSVTGLSSYTLAGRLGMNYQINEKWAVGGTYTSKSSMDLENGEMKANFGAMGVVTYKDVSMEDFTWPQQFEVGLSFRPSPKWLLAFDISWINWANAIETVKVKASNPNVAVPPQFQNLDVPFIMDWKDQWVFALGAQYEINQNWTVRAGYNYGASPVPDETLNPLFPAIVEHHATVGFTFTYGDFDIDFAYEHGFENTQKNTGALSQTNPFAGTEVSHYQHTLHFMFSYRF